MSLQLAWAVRDSDVPHLCKGNFDFDDDVDGSDAHTFKLHFGRSLFKNPCPPDGPAPVEKTLLTEPVGDYDDGCYQKGVPLPTPRFTDLGNGTVTDNLTGLMWTKNVQEIPGFMLWQEALDACQNLVFAGHNDWRLANVKELISLIDYGRYDPSLPAGHPFIGEVSYDCWSSTTLSGNSSHAWVVYFDDGLVYNYDKSSREDAVRCVRGGH